MKQKQLQTVECSQLQRALYPAHSWHWRLSPSEMQYMFVKERSLQMLSWHWIQRLWFITLLQRKANLESYFLSCFRVAIAICSGNVDLHLLQRCIARALTLESRVCRFSLVISDSPADVSKLLEVLAREEARVLDIRQERTFVTSELFTVEVTCTVETRDKIHTAQLRNALLERYPTAAWTERWRAARRRGWGPWTSILWSTDLEAFGTNITFQGWTLSK